jgi:hypothetical protein
MPRSATLVVAAASLLCSCSSTPPALTGGHSVANQQIASDLNTLFDLAHPDVQGAIADIADSGQLGTAIANELPRIGYGIPYTGARVDHVYLLSKNACAKIGLSFPCARVVYDVLARNRTLVHGKVGFATVSDDRWVIAKPTVCGLLIQYAPVAGTTNTYIPGC